MTGSRYDRPKRVVQAYRRLDEAESADNPYPTLDSAAQAIERKVLAPPPTAPEMPMVTRPALPVFTLRPDEIGPGQTRGAIYDSRREAARAALEAVNIWSIASNGEHAFLVYQDPKTGRFGHTTPVYTGFQGGENIALRPGPGRTVGMGHTHGAYSTGQKERTNRSGDGWNSDDFSSGGAGTDYETMRRNKNGFDAYYLGTPSGAFYEWTPKDRKKTQF